MSYASLLEQEGIASNFLAVIRPRRLVTSWTLHAVNVYKADFTHGPVARVWSDADELTEGSSTALSPSEFFYDVYAQILYVRVGASTDPATKTMSVAYELYVGTTDANFYRDPTDDTSREVYFEALIKQSPSVTSSVADSLFGFLPVQSASITLSNSTHVLDRHLYDSTFSKAEIFIYHALGAFETTNIKKILSGTCGNMRGANSEVQIQVYTKLDVFSSEFRHPSGVSFYGTTTFPDLDPSFNARPIRLIYGLVEGVIPVNIDYQAPATATTSDNREWVVMGGQADLASIVEFVSISPASTSTRTYCNSYGLNVGDTVSITPVANNYATVTAVDPGGTYFDHTAGVPADGSAGDIVRRKFVGNIVIYQNGIRYQPMPGRDWDSNPMAGNTMGISFNTAMEANTGMASTFNPDSDRIFCRVYGRKNSVTVNGTPVGGNDLHTKNMVNPIAIVVDLLHAAGVPDSEIDESGLVALAGTMTEAIGAVFPDTGSQQMPIYRDMISALMETILGRFFINSDNEWTVKVLAPTSVADIEIDDTEIVAGSFNFSQDYSELLSNIFVEYDKRETQDSSTKTNQTKMTIGSVNNNSEYLHHVKRQRTFQALLFRESDAQTLSDRLSYIFGERRGIMDLSTKNRFFSTLISDNVEVSSLRMPGFEFDGVTQGSDLLSVIETQKGLRSVDLTLDDLKGVNDNVSNW